MKNDFDNVEYFYEKIIPDFLNYSKKINRNKQIKIFKRLPLMNWCVSVVISSIIYFLMMFLFFPFRYIDLIFFLKTEYFKNKTNGTSLFFRAIWSSLILIGAFFLFCSYYEVDLKCNLKDSIQVFGISLGIFFGLYWNARSVFTQKWNYAAGMFNKLCFELPFKNYKNLELKQITIHFYQVTFSLDLLVVEIWSHKSFYASFREAVEFAYAYKEFKDYVVKFGHADKNIIMSNINQKIMSLYNGDPHDYEKIKDILATYQEDLSNYVVHTNKY